MLLRKLPKLSESVCSQKKTCSPVGIEQNANPQQGKLRKTAAPGPVGLLQSLGESVIIPLEIIFNKSIDTECISEDWRTLNVTQFTKKHRR